MKRHTILLTVTTALGLSAAGVALANQTETVDSTQTEARMFQAAKISLKGASSIALKEVPGTLSAIGFNDENGRGIYEAIVVTADGSTSIVKIDANSGAVLGKGLASVMNDGQDEGENGQERVGQEHNNE